MDILKKLEEKAKENQERWESIEELMNRVKKTVNGDSETRTQELTELNTAMLLLLVEQLRPMVDTSQSANIGDLLNSMLGSKGGE